MLSLALPSSRREFLEQLARLGMAGGMLGSLRGQAPSATDPVPTTVVGFPGVWSFGLPKYGLILVSDQQLDDLQDPDKEVDLSLSSTPNRTTLRKVCAGLKQSGGRTVILAFDEFWSQYRAGQGGKPRQLTPDTDEYLARIQRVSQTLKEYGLGLELSLLSPLEIGAGYARQTGESGRWVQYREGWRDPRTGRFEVALWEQRHWTNNKGTIEVRRTGVRAFAYRERRVGASNFYHVAPADIVELTSAVDLEEAEPEGERARSRRLIVRGSGDTGVGPKDRVLVVVSYQTPEMDYFSPKAPTFLRDLVKRYHEAGVPLHGLYADEMHIQQDWGYNSHHDEGQFALRYLTENFMRRFAERYGADYADFEKYLVYFCYGQHGFYPNLEARLPALHVMGADPDSIHATALLRRRYFDLLERTVVELFASAKAETERLYGREMEARAHATWAQSPTIDFWQTRGGPHAPRQYEYTADFLWSNTVHQAASACSDYFRWNAFLTGGGNDHAEGGWSDRNYYALALACSTGILNRTPNAYAAAWGMPDAALRRHQALADAFGCAASPPFQAIEDGEHRDTEVLMLYPASLVAWEERFGSWMTQYGYANYVTPDTLLERGKVGADGWVEMAGRRFGTIAVLFEPLPPAGLLGFLEEIAKRGGRVIWSGPPPRTDLGGHPVADPWRRLFAIEEVQCGAEGLVAAGQRVEFEGLLKSVPPQDILTDFAVDLIYPVAPGAQGQVVARSSGRVVGVHRRIENGGTVTFLGFRPRDDQAASLGYEVRTWFEVLRELGAYPCSREGAADNPAIVSRQSPYFASRFPNGTVAVSAHYRRHVESWPGGFHRNAADDEKILQRNPLPSDRLELHDFAVDGDRLEYQGDLLMAYRPGPEGTLLAFGGYACDRIRLNGREFVFADRPMAQVAWAPVNEARLLSGGALMELWVDGDGRLRIPVPDQVTEASLFFQGSRPGSLGDAIPASVREGHLEFEAKATWPQKHLFLL